MGIVVSLLLLTAGLFMRFALTVEADSFDVHTAGVILILIGIIGAVMSIAFWASWGGFDRFGGRRHTVVVSQPQPQRIVSTSQPVVTTTTVQEHDIR